MYNVVKKVTSTGHEENTTVQYIIIYYVQINIYNTTLKLTITYQRKNI